MHESGKQGGEAGVALLTITPSDPLGEPETLDAIALEFQLSTG